MPTQKKKWFVDIEPIHGRTWRVTPRLNGDGTIREITMVWGCAERTFKPGEESDTITKAGLAAAEALVSMQQAPAFADDESFALIEQFAQ